MVTLIQAHSGPGRLAVVPVLSATAKGSSDDECSLCAMIRPIFRSKHFANLTLPYSVADWTIVRRGASVRKADPFSIEYFTCASKLRRVLMHIYICTRFD